MSAIDSSATPGAKSIPIGLELWTVRTELNQDPLATLAAVASLGYEAVEFFSTYLDWSLEHAAEIRRRLDDLGLVVPSTHNGMRAFRPEALAKTVELNQMLGCRLAVVASIPPVTTVEGWKGAAEEFTAVADMLRPHGIASGFHNNHQGEWRPLDGHRPMDLVAAHTPQDFVLQFDVGPAVEAGADPVAWIQAHPGRIRCLHLRDWSRAHGYHVAFGEGDSPWMDIFAAAETVGGAECYLIEHGHATPEQGFPMAERGLANYRAMRQGTRTVNPGSR